MFHAGMIRRHATVFQGATTRMAEFMAGMFGGVAKLSLAAGLLGLVIYLRQYHPERIDPWLTDQIAALLDRFPKTSTLRWSVFGVADAYVLFSVMRTRRRFKKKEVRLPDTRISV